MLDNLILHTFCGEEEYTQLADILTASENADSQPRTVSAADLAERLSTSSPFDLLRDLVITEMDGQEVGYGRVGWWTESALLKNPSESRSLTTGLTTTRLRD